MKAAHPDKHIGVFFCGPGGLFTGIRETCRSFNPRLVSGDVGIGLNVRRLRDGFLSTFATAYALRPVGEVGTVYKRWPGKLQVFIEDERAPGRYKLSGDGKGFDVAPAGEALDLIFSQALASASKSQQLGGGTSSVKVTGARRPEDARGLMTVRPRLSLGLQGRRTAGGAALEGAKSHTSRRFFSVAMSVPR